MVKQVIVVNMKVPMGIGRLAAQAAHASIGVFLDKGCWNTNGSFEISNISDAMKYWMDESFTKVVLKEWGEQKLINLVDKAKELNLPTYIMEDDGHLTAIAIGPGESEVIDYVTGKLTLL